MFIISTVFSSNRKLIENLTKRVGLKRNVNYLALEADLGCGELKVFPIFTSDITKIRGEYRHISEPLVKYDIADLANSNPIKQEFERCLKERMDIEGVETNEVRILHELSNLEEIRVKWKNINGRSIALLFDIFWKDDRYFVQFNEDLEMVAILKPCTYLTSEHDVFTWWLNNWTTMFKSLPVDAYRYLELRIFDVVFY